MVSSLPLPAPNQFVQLLEWVELKCAPSVMVGVHPAGVRVQLFQHTNVYMHYVSAWRNPSLVWSSCPALGWKGAPASAGSKSPELGFTAWWNQKSGVWNVWLHFFLAEWCNLVWTACIHLRTTCLPLWKQTASSDRVGRQQERYVETRERTAGVWRRGVLFPLGSALLELVQAGQVGGAAFLLSGSYRCHLSAHHTFTVQPQPTLSFLLVCPDLSDADWWGQGWGGWRSANLTLNDIILMHIHIQFSSNACKCTAVSWTLMRSCEKTPCHIQSQSAHDDLSLN